MSAAPSVFDTPGLLVMDYQSTNSTNVLGKDNYRTITAQSGITTNWGQAMRFQLPKQGRQFITQVNLELKFDAVDNSDATETYTRLCDAAPLFAIQEINLRYEGETKYTVRGIELYHYLLANNSPQPLEVMRRGSMVGYTEAERDTISVAESTHYVYLDEYFELLNHAFPAWILRSDVEIEVKFHYDQRSILESDQHDTASVDIKSCQLRVEYTENEAVANYVDIPRHKPLYAHMFMHRTIDLAAGVDQLTTTLPALNGKRILTIAMILRDKTNIEAGLPAVYDGTDGVSIASWSLKSASKYIAGVEGDIDMDFFRKCLLNNYYPNGRDYFLDKSCPVIYYGDDMGVEFKEDGQQYRGGRYFTESDAMLTVNLSGVPTNNLQLDLIICHCENHVLKDGVIQLGKQ